MRTFLPSLHPRSVAAAPLDLCVWCASGGLSGETAQGGPSDTVTQASEGVGLWLTVSPLPGQDGQCPPPLPALSRTPGGAATSPIHGVSEGRSVCSRRGHWSPWCKWCLDGLPGAPFRESGQALGSLVPAIPWVLCPGSRWLSPSTSTPLQMLCNHLRGPGHSPSQERELYI